MASRQAVATELIGSVVAFIFVGYHRPAGLPAIGATVARKGISNWLSGGRLWPPFGFVVYSWMLQKLDVR